MKTLPPLIGRTLFWLTWPLVYLYLRFGPVRPRIIVECAGEVLFVKGWFSSGLWQLPGGGKSRSEHAAACVIRELKEETGIRVGEHEIKQVIDEMATSQGFRFRYIVFLVRLKAKPAVRLRQGELTGFSWIGKADILQRQDINKLDKRAVNSIN